MEYRALLMEYRALLMYLATLPAPDPALFSARPRLLQHLGLRARGRLLTSPRADRRWCSADSVDVQQTS